MRRVRPQSPFQQFLPVDTHNSPKMPELPEPHGRLHGERRKNPKWLEQWNRQELDLMWLVRPDWFALKTMAKGGHVVSGPTKGYLKSEAYGDIDVWLATLGPGLEFRIRPDVDFSHPLPGPHPANLPGQAQNRTRQNQSKTLA